MVELSNLLRTIISAIVDDVVSVKITEVVSDSSLLCEVSVAQCDIGKIIGKQGRIANAIRVVVKAAAAKSGHKIMVNILNKPFSCDEVS